MSDTKTIPELKFLTVHYKNETYKVYEPSNTEFKFIADLADAGDAEKLEHLKLLKKEFTEKNMEKIFYYFRNNTFIKLELKDIQNMIAEATE